MKLIPEETFEEMLADKRLTKLVEFCTKRCTEHDQDFDLLFRSRAVPGATKKIKRCLQPGQWEKFIELWNDCIARAREVQNDPQTKEALDEEMEKIQGILRNPNNNPEIMQAAEKLRTGGGRNVRPFNSEWMDCDQLRCISQASESLSPSMPDIIEGKKYINRQKESGLRRWEEGQIKHEHWRKLQADEIDKNPQFAKKSKLDQAAQLKRKYNIQEKTNTIAKRLAPLPTSTK